MLWDTSIEPQQISKKLNRYRFNIGDFINKYTSKIEVVSLKDAQTITNKSTSKIMGFSIPITSNVHNLGPPTKLKTMPRNIE